MKKVKLFFGLILSLVVLASCSNDEVVSKNETETGSFAARDFLDCPEGTIKVLSAEFVTHRLHRASTGCARRFSICSEYRWVERCIDKDLLPQLNVDNTLVQRTAEVFITTLPGNKLLIRFPIALLSDADFISSDFTTFGFDADYDINGSMIIASGDYTPVVTATEIQVTVDLR